ncbi:UDP-N-acetylmuramoyl-L-alanine--D-glutamate ligase [Draconibacterium sp. IB214405]|uniref:UDP-N-acetylmuramoyl-L-alanine--D-glutamate ligase n=1 Tax=Draconibacterium sp. IB214405 TaxID=3097352 RepID=UPI002A183AD1|nr:UDP-N-acetylmuramoyl-L-alanine--D-glutamate ligase [Draconibacterium sp. IB214405]MDX8338585.1 UDP-N-acetylmuramoyl-L-alanine--D-glutamate ligase [Draconibacterium sp. IB214405]
MKGLVAILGGGESGVGAAILAQKRRYDVFVSDLGKIKEKYKDVLSNYKIDFEEGHHSEEKILSAELVVKSPGIPETAPLVKKLKEQGTPVISEIEFGGRFSSAKTICITGSNGKTTTTLLTYHILQKAGVNVGLAGNVGKSFAWQVAEEDFDVYVIELSSFQLDGMYDFKADVAVLMNITPDHLDRYGYDMQNYTDSKFRILQNQTANDYFVYCDDDEVIQNEINKREIKPVQLPFGLGEAAGPGAGVRDNRIIINFNQNQFSMSILDLSLQGKHNTYNSMAAGIASMVLKIRDEQLRESLSDFTGVEHRLERFLKVHGIEFINDSKATNVNSSWYALESVHKPVIWIAGGVDKGNDYTMLQGLVTNKVKAIVCLGKNNAKLHEAFGDCVADIVDASSMEEAVKAAYYLARNGDTVLLSPACASFDLFENYEDRGNQFKKEVRNL